MSAITTISSKMDPGELEGILEAYNEVTERLKQSHEMLRAEVSRLRDQLDEKNKELARRERLAALGEMAAGVAHEIRNPVGGIGLYASLLVKDLSDRPRSEEIAKKIGAGVKKVECIISDILAFARGAEPELLPTNLWALVERLLVQISPQARVANVSVEVEDSLRNLLVRCDELQVERALLNLIYNAIDATNPEGVVRLFKGGVHEDGKLVGIVVADDGPGLAEENIQRVFNPFFTTKDSGTGLGLAIVHRIAEAHGGWISVENGVEGGARFELTLPTTTSATV